MFVTQGLHRAMQIQGDDVAIVFGDRRRSWRELGARVARFAAGLVSLGVKRGDRVAVIALNSDRYIEAYFALAWMGAIVVPGNTRWTVPEHIHALQDSGATWLLVDRTFAGMLEPIARACAFAKIVHLDDGPAPDGMVGIEDLIAAATPIEDGCGRGDDIAGIFYTGGTTGRSKGVMISHGGITSAFFCQNAMVPFPEDLVYLHGPAMFHLSGAQPLIGVTLMGGRHIVIPSFTPDAVVRAIVEERVTSSMFVPTMFAMLRDHVAGRAMDFGSMTQIYYGAAPISQSLLRDAMAMFPNAGFVQVYGQSEVGGCATLLETKFHRAAETENPRLRSAGRPICGIDVRIVDTAMQECRRGEVGEIAISSPGKMLGYWQQPELTNDVVVDAWVRTGDAAYMDADGFVYIVDRMKDMIVSGGENIYSAEVENALAGHPAVAACAVIGIPDPKWGESVHAIVQLKEAVVASEGELIRHCRSVIAGYKCPRSIELRPTPLPLSGAGKILKTDLRKPFWEGHERRVG